MLERIIVMTLFERIKLLAKNQGKSINDIERDLGQSKNTLYRLQSSNPSAEKLKELADYFDVSTDYLLGRSNNPSIDRSLDSADLDKILDNAKSFDGKPMTDTDREAIRAFLEGRFSK